MRRDASREPRAKQRARTTRIVVPLAYLRRAATRPVVETEAEEESEDFAAATTETRCLAATAGRANAEQRAATPPEDRRGAEARIFSSVEERGVGAVLDEDARGEGGGSRAGALLPGSVRDA